MDIDLKRAINNIKYLVKIVPCTMEETSEYDCDHCLALVFLKQMEDKYGEELL